MFYPHYSNIPRLFWGSQKSPSPGISDDCPAAVSHDGGMAVESNVADQRVYHGISRYRERERTVEMGNPLIRLIDVPNPHWLVDKKREV